MTAPHASNPFPSLPTPAMVAKVPSVHPAPRRFVRPLLRLRRPRLLLVGESSALAPVIERIARQVDGDVVIDRVATALEARRMLRAIAYHAVVVDPGESRDAGGLVLGAWCRRLQPEARFGVLSSLSVRDLVDREPIFPALPRPFSGLQLRGFLETLLVG